MTIASEIQRIQTNIANTYDALEAKGATMPATENSDNLASTVATISGGSGDIITAKNATGSAILEGDKVWLEKKAGGGIRDFNTYYGQYITIDDNTEIISFSDNSSPSIYKKFSSGFTAPTQYLEFQVKVKQGGWVGTNTGNSYGISLCGYDITYGHASYCNIQIKLENHVYLYVAPANAWSNFISSTVFDVNAWYWIKVRITNSQIVASWSTDGVNWVSTTYNGSNILSNYTTGYSKAYSAQPAGNDNTFRGIYDLSEWYVKADDQIWWTPYLDSQVGFNYLPYSFSSANSFTGFATENIASGAEGDAKTVMPETLSVSITADANDATITVE